MDLSTKMPHQTSLFQVYLRLRPPVQNQPPKQTDQWLIVESSTTQSANADEKPPASPTHITLQPPNDSRKRAIERFGFTKVFQEEATQLDIFEESGAADSVKSVLSTGRDGLIATLGVTGSGKSHTILGSRSQRGLTQMTLDLLFRSIGQNIRSADHQLLPTGSDLLHSLQACDTSEAQIQSASSFLESTYGHSDGSRNSRAQTPMVVGGSRAQTPMTVWHPVYEAPGVLPTFLPASKNPSGSYPIPSPLPRDPGLSSVSNHYGLETPTIRLLPSVPEKSLPKTERKPWVLPSRSPFWNRSSDMRKKFTKLSCVKESLATHRRPPIIRVSTLPQAPDVSHHAIPTDPSTDYVVLVSMYEVYNDRIFDLLSSPSNTFNIPTTTRAGTNLARGLMRRPLLFKNTEASPERKLVTGLRKILCSSYEEAIMVLETGLMERRVAGTGSNSVSSRSHGFFCIEVKHSSKVRDHFRHGVENWTGGTLSVVDLAGSERARNAKTTGSTLAEAGKINESLMYLGQCLQVQSEAQNSNPGQGPTIVPFRQCKLTELLFSNSFPSANVTERLGYRPPQLQPQKAIMIVTADPQGDFNATSQILRYSALAREVTVPRIPSVTSTIFHSAASHNSRTADIRPGTASGRITPCAQWNAEELDAATHEISRLSEELDNLGIRLAEEEIRRTEAELRLQAAEDKAAMLEQEVREECWIEMELRFEEEKMRWRRARNEQKVRGEEYLDEKIEILEQSQSEALEFSIHEDMASKTEVAEGWERENEMLRAKIEALERELQMRSPTKKSSKMKPAAALQESMSNTNIGKNPFLRTVGGQIDPQQPVGHENNSLFLTSKMSTLEIADFSPRKLSLRNSIVNHSQLLGDEVVRQPSGTKMPSTAATKAQRKLTTRKWDLGDPDELAL